MKTIVNTVTVLAVVGMLLGVGMLDGDPVAGVALIYISMIVLAARCYFYEQKRIKEDKR